MYVLQIMSKQNEVKMKKKEIKLYLIKILGKKRLKKIWNM